MTSSDSLHNATETESESAVRPSELVITPAPESPSGVSTEPLEKETAQAVSFSASAASEESNFMQSQKVEVTVIDNAVIDIANIVEIPKVVANTTANNGTIGSTIGGATATTPATNVCNLSSTGAPLYDSRLADLAVLPSRIVSDKRFWRMAKTVIRLSKVGAENKWFPNKEISEEERKKLFAISFRETLVEFGPTFIKLGQFLSVRRDLLTVEMADELESLQDKVPPFDRELVHSTILNELGREPEKIFAEFNYEPMGSASIGQVHKAKLQDGRDVVVKVQRPDLAQRFYQDLGYMRTFISWGRRLKPDGDWDGWMALSDEFGRTLFSEIDYLQEGKNADRMRTAIKEQTRIRIPRVIWKHTGRHVLTLEYAPGIKIDKIEELKAAGFNLENIGNELINCYMEQVLIHGFFHADPHAGNLAIDEEGRIIIYDFGMIGEISESQRMAIAGCVTSVIEKNSDNVAIHLIELGVLKADANQVPIIRTLGPFMDYYSGKSIKDLDFTDLERDIDQIAFEKALKLPANLAYLLRTGSSLEGIARTLQPNFSFIEAAKPFIQRWLLTKPSAFGPLLKFFFQYGQEAYRKGADKLTSGVRSLGMRQSDVRKSSTIGRSPTNLSTRDALKKSSRANSSIGKSQTSANPPGSDGKSPSSTKSAKSAKPTAQKTQSSQSSVAMSSSAQVYPVGAAPGGAANSSKSISVSSASDNANVTAGATNNFNSASSASNLNLKNSSNSSNSTRRFSGNFSNDNSSSRPESKNSAAKSDLSAGNGPVSHSFQPTSDETKILQEQLYLLETRLKQGALLQTRLSVCSLVLVFLSTLICAASFLPEYRSYATYFLIGNGVMGAIILWHLVNAALLGKKFQEKR